MATRRSGLGRGLGALIPNGEQPQSTASSGTETIDLTDKTFREVPVDSIRPNTYQPRQNIDQTELQPLADSIRELGILQPILVRPVDNSNSSYELIAGERRWRAAMIAGLKNVPVIVRTSDDAHSLEQALVENLHRRDLNPIDEAAAYRQLIDDFSMTHDSVAKRVGKSRAAVSNLLRLMQLQPKIQHMLINEQITEGHGRALLGTDDQAFQLQIAERVVREGMPVRAVEDAVRLRTELAKPQSKKRAGGTSAASKAASAVLEWQDRLTDYLDTRVTISTGSRNGKIVIDFADLEDLDRVSGIIENGVDDHH